MGRTIIKNLEKHARVPCGYAALADVSTGQHEDRMDSFVLAETFKYLYLLFDSPSHRFIDTDQFLFTTEAHLLPLNLSLFRINDTMKREMTNHSIFDKHDTKKMKINQCPAMDEQLKSHQYKEQLRENIRANRDMTAIFTKTDTTLQQLTPTEFSKDRNNPDHLSQLNKMGISLRPLPDGRKYRIDDSLLKFFDSI